MAITQVTLHTQFSEWKDITNAIIGAVGDNDSLNSAEKSSLVAAINEVLSKLGAVASLNTTAKSNAVAAINEVLSNVGDVDSLHSSFNTISDLVAAVNNLVGRIGTLNNLNTTAKSSIVVAVNELVQSISGVSDKVGTLANLNTTAKTNLVVALNELVTNIGALGDLNTTAKDDVVAAINEVVQSVSTASNKVGDLTALSTTAKGSAVAAINELNALRLTASNVPMTNLMDNRGRFSAEATKVLTTFDATMLQMTAYNSAVIAEGDRFIDDNSNYGGAGGTLGSDIGALMNVLDSAGRTDKRNGYEFYIANVTAGGGTSDPEVFNTNNFYPVFTGSDAFLGGIGSTVTFQCWIRAKTVVDEATFGGILLGATGVQTVVDGVEQDEQSNLTVADGWVHLSQQVVLTNEYKKFFPAIFANNADVVQIAMPTLFNADVEGIHLGIM